MFAQLKKLIHDCLTENDGKSYCPFRVSGAALSATSIPTYAGAAITCLIKSGTLDFVAFGTGFAAIMGGLGLLAGGVAFKARTDTRND